MQLHHIKPTHLARKKKRIGRGGKRGTTSGAGQKGQKARAGRSLKPQVREMMLRFPKLRGIKFKPQKPAARIISLDLIERAAQKGDIITPTWLMKKGILSGKAEKLSEIKILKGKKELTKAVTIQGIALSESATKQVIACGGTVVTAQ
ncbi:MAG: uL15 family ribosomal protein [Patescibacteria group bacterium]|nr:uL15 family ribosomal protein [Patescibacteria group bacterium]MDE2437825.1 uL15 family ribosomal protein [Patescibacteria group bacterium]